MMTAAIIRIDEQRLTAGVELFGDSLIEAFLLKYTENTRKTYLNAVKQLRKYFVTNGIVQPARRDVEKFFAWLKTEKKSPATRRLYLTVVKSYFAFLTREGVYADIAADVTEKFIKPEKHSKDTLTTAQARSLIASVAGDNVMARRDRAIIALALQTGLRTCEISRADYGDFVPNQYGEGYLLYVKGKGRNDDSMKVEVRVAPPVVTLIKAYLELRGSVGKADPLFVSTSRNTGWKKNQYGNRLSEQSIQKLIKRAMVTVGIRSVDPEKDNNRVTPHSTRHYAATTAILAGVDIREVSAMLRHTAINITAVYLHDLAAVKRRAEMAVSDTLFSGATI